MNHPDAIRPETHAVYSPEKMGKSTLFSSERIMVGLNAFEPGQEHKLHAHEGMDKVYHVLSGACTVRIGEERRTLTEGHTAVAPAGVVGGS